MPHIKPKQLESWSSDNFPCWPSWQTETPNFSIRKSTFCQRGMGKEWQKKHLISDSHLPLQKRNNQMKRIYKKTPSMYKQLRLYYYITAWLYISVSICIILWFASPHHQESIFTGWPDFWTINSVHHVSLTFYNVYVQEFMWKKSPQTFFVQPLEISNWCYENTYVFPPFTSRI